MSDHRTNKVKRLIRWLSPLTAAALAAALLSVQPSAATASAAPDPEPPPDLAVASYASDYSVSLAEAQRRLDRIQPLQEILASIRSLEDARLAGWGIDHGPSFGGWVWLTGDDPPGAAAAAVAAAHADVRIRTGADHSHAELLAAQQSLFRNGATGRVNDGPAPGVARMVTFTGIDMAANAVRIGIDPALASVVPGGLTDTGPVTVTDEAFQAKAAQVTAQLADTISVNYAVEDGRGLAVEATFAGGQQVGGCTSGFAARQRGTSVYGIITAGHCKRSLDMHGVRLRHVIQREGPYVDARFLSIPSGSSHRLLDKFVCGNPHPCGVSSDISRGRMMGDYVCHYGKNSGNSCGTINDINFSPNHALFPTDLCRPTSCSNTFVRAGGDSLVSCEGDSGGPWYYRDVAYGIHSGSTSSDDCNTGGTIWFSAIQDVENQLRVDILFTGPVTIR